MTVRVRFAPSPTGYLHIGGVRTALYNWLFAKQNNGEFLLRIEDSDQNRSTQEAEKAIFDGLKSLGLIDNDFDETSVMRNTDESRQIRYREVAQSLLDNHQAYYCDCNASSDGMWEVMCDCHFNYTLESVQQSIDDGIPVAIRFKVPTNGVIEWDDLIKGNIKIDNKFNEHDFVIMRHVDKDKPLGTPLYNFACAIDDFDMGITHIIRGDDHVANTPKQIQILTAWAKHNPSIEMYLKNIKFGHLPLIMVNGKKMSKRKSNDEIGSNLVSLTDFQSNGYLNSAILHYLLAFGGSRDIDVFDEKIANFQPVDLIQNFDLNKISTHSTNWDEPLLEHFNTQHYKFSNPKLVANTIGVELNEHNLDIIVFLQKRLGAKQSFSTFKSEFDMLNLKYATLDNGEYSQARDVFIQIASVVNDTLCDVNVHHTYKVEVINKSIKDYCKKNDLPYSDVAMLLRRVLYNTEKAPSIAETLVLGDTWKNVHLFFNC